MNKTVTLFIRCSLVALLAITLSSCQGENIIKRGDSLQVAFKKAMNLYEAEQYANAINAFETVLEIGRGTDYGQEAQFYLAESYYNDERYLLAASEYERYMSLFPRSPRYQDVMFKEAYCYYQLSPRYKLDQSYTRTAIEKFRIFNSEYPNSERADQAAEYITEMRAKLAKKLYHAADLYMRIDDYDAAITYYDLTINDYPESIWAQRALVDKIHAYNVYASRSVQSKQAERYQKAVSAYEKFIQLFPEGEYRSQADEYVDRARSALAELKVDSEGDNSTASVQDSDESNF